jgi:PAS domain S-box-containing protein
MPDVPGTALGNLLGPHPATAEEIVHAILLGEADAFVVETKAGPRVYALKGTNEPYRHLVERMSESAAVLGQDGTILYSNGRLAKMLGYEDLAGHGFLDLVAAEQQRRAERVIASGSEFQAAAEMTLLAVDGTGVRVRVSAAPMTFEGEPCIAVVVTALDDVAALKASEAALRESEERLRLTVEATGIGTWEWDLTTNACVWNDHVYRVLGYIPGAVTPSYDAWAQRVLPEDLAPTTARVQHMLEHGGDYRAEYRALGPNNEIRWVEGRGRAVRDAGGKPLRVFGVVIDITERKRSDEALQESEERFRLLVEQAVDGIFLSDATGRYVDVNSAGHKMLGYTRDEILSRTIVDVIAPEEVSRLAPAIAGFAGGRVTRTEWRFRRKDGSELIGEVVGRQLPDGRLLGILRDISGRRQAEEDLRASQQRTRLATETTEVGIWEWDVKTGAILWDDQMFRIYGIPPAPDGMVNYGIWAQAVLPEDLAREEALLQKTVREGGTNRREFRLRRRDNGEIRVIQAVETTRADAQGDTRWVVGTNLDITERKQAEAALQHQNALLSTVFESLPVGLCVFDANGTLTFRNSTTKAIWGEVPGRQHGPVKGWWRRTGERVGTADWPGVKARRQGITTLREVIDIEGGDGVRRTILDTAMPLRNAHGAIIGAVTITEDVTERLAAEEALKVAKAEAERAVLARSKFLAAASHDLRQPVQSLVLLTALLKRRADNPAVVKTVDMMELALNGLTGLLTSILDISRLDAGVVMPQMRSTDMAAMINRLAQEYALPAAEKGLRLHVVAHALQAFTDPELLERMLRNLIENALRYTQRGGLLLGVRLRGKHVRIDVVDTGIGIPDDKQPHIFEEFYQVGNPGRDSLQGLGLGLAIVGRLSRLLGVEMQLRSREGHGSRFSLLLPLDPKAAQPPAARLPAPETLAKGRVLMIEDNVTVGTGFQLLLESWGYEVVRAEAGEQALEICAAEGWRLDAIVTDHRLGPGLTGTQTAKEIRARAGRAIPTLVITGDTGPERIAEIHASGFEMLHKPVGAEELQLKLAHILRGA